SRVLLIKNKTPETRELFGSNRPRVLLIKNKTPETRELFGSNRPRVLLIKNKTPVISRSFNHQSKNEQSIKLLFVII
ncbi:hypothetical protein, partial [Flavobacterium sp. 14A]|uniref:hypothetical protein n=1 Tax=Flavobacterium sp. 14A TaxID=2735896 RepID=UPI001C2D2A99